MGKITTPMTLQEMQNRNPAINVRVLAVYCDALKLYEEATANLAKNGALSGHPKTGAPMVNPYLAIRDAASKAICRFHKDYPKFF